MVCRFKVVDPYCIQYLLRTENWAGIAQYINPDLGSNYKFTAEFKLLNPDSDQLWHLVEIMIQENFQSGNIIAFLFNG